MIADKQCISQFTKYATASGLCVQSVTPSGWLTEYTFTQVLFSCTTLNIAEIIKRIKKLTSSLKGRNLFFSSLHFYWNNQLYCGNFQLKICTIDSMTS